MTRRISERGGQHATALLGHLSERVTFAHVHIGSDRLMPRAEEGDVLLIDNVGAYGRVMSSRYNLREPATEVAI